MKKSDLNRLEKSELVELCLATAREKDMIREVLIETERVLERKLKYWQKKANGEPSAYKRTEEQFKEFVKRLYTRAGLTRDEIRTVLNLDSKTVTEALKGETRGSEMHIRARGGYRVSQCEKRVILILHQQAHLTAVEIARVLNRDENTINRVISSELKRKNKKQKEV